MRVICVDDSPGYTTGLPSGLVKWKEYNVYPCGHRRHFDGGYGYRVEGVPWHRRNTCWRAERFRPIKEVDVNAMFRCEEMVNT